MKRKICLLLALMLLISHTAFAKVTENEDLYVSQAEALVSLLLGGNALKGNENGTVSRGEFVAALGGAFNHADIVAEAGFADVSKEHVFAGKIYAAKMLGYVSAAENFYPDADITGAEAIKLSVCYGGYREVAERKGGYPTGYIELARVNGYLKNLPTDFAARAVSAEEAKILVYNVMLSDYVAVMGMNENASHYKKTGTNLSEIHKIYEKTGVVNAVAHTSLSGEERNHEKMLIELEGETYRYENNSSHLLGRNCTVFYKEEGGNKEALLIVPVKNTEYTFSLENFLELKSGKIEYLDDETDEKEEISLDKDNVYLVYNGCGTYPDNELFSGEGTVSIIDNDRDGEGEVIILNKYRYAKVDSISTANGDIGFSDSFGLNNLSLNNDVLFEMFNSKGEEITIYDIKKGDYLALLESENKKSVNITLLDNIFSGSVNELDLGNLEIKVSGETKKLTSYFEKKYFNKVNLGVYYNFILAPGGAIVAMESLAGGAEYAYLTAYDEPKRALSDGKVKLFTQNNEFLVLDCSKDITIDAKSTKVKGSDFISELKKGTYPCPSMVKIKYSKEGSLTEIDFPENYVPGMDKESLPEGDNFLKYNFPVTTFTYRSGAKSCMPYFNVKSSMVFKIPRDLEEEEYFEISDYSSFSDNTSYSLEVYDLDDAGTPEAILRRINTKSETFNHNHATYIVESVTDGLDGDGQPVKYVNCWSMGKYRLLYLDNDYVAEKDSGAPLGGGDIIRVNLNKDDKIMSLVVDFDASSGVPCENSYAGSIYSLGNVSFTYQYGKLFRSENDYAYITNAVDDFGEYDYSFENLKNCYINTRYIIKYDTKTKTLRPLLSDELKSFVTHGNDNHFVILRQNVFNINSIYVYE